MLTKADGAATTAALLTKADGPATTTAMAGKVDTSAFTEANTQRVLADTRLETLIVDGLALKHPLITAAAPLSQSLVSGLTAALANQADTSAFCPTSGPPPSQAT